MGGATLAKLDLPQQIMLELQIINRTLHSIHSTLKEVSYQINLDWFEREKSKSEEEELPPPVCHSLVMIWRMLCIDIDYLELCHSFMWKRIYPKQLACNSIKSFLLLTTILILLHRLLPRLGLLVAWIQLPISLSFLPIYQPL